MKKVIYYTDKEAQEKMMELFSEGKGVLALKDDPKCPPDMKAKLQKLSDLHFETMVSIMADKAKKGGSYDA